MPGKADAERLRLLADRAAWLRKESQGIRTRVLVEKAFADEYWTHWEGTTAWARFIAARRLSDARRALLGKKRKR